MKNQTSVIIMIVILSLLPILPKAFIHIASAEPETTVRVEPTEHIFYVNTTSLGDKFNVSIIGRDIPDPGFFGWEVLLSWTPGVINCTGETLNVDIWDGYKLGPWVPVPIDNVAGTYHQSLTGSAPGTPKSGTFWLANLTFQIVDVPLEGQTLQTELHVGANPPSTYCLADLSATEIPHDFIHGIYKLISPRPPLPETTLKVAPPTILNPSLTPCTTFNVSVDIVNAVYLYGFSLKLGYNSTMVTCVGVEEGDLLKGFGETTMTNIINNTWGYTFVSINLTAPEAMADGNGTLAKFTFHVENTGESDLHLYETQLYDSEGAPLTHDTSDGYFNNILMPIIYVDPPVLIDPEMALGDGFQVQINVANVSDLYDFEFKLVYDTNVLTGLGVIVIPFDNETSFELEFALNDTEGEVWVKVQYYPPAEPLTAMSPVTVVELFFQVQSYGATWLHFNQSSLSDSMGMQITHVAQDGYVSILRRDVSIESVTPELTEIYKGWIINITITAKNLGDISETFSVTLYAESNEIGTQQVSGLPPNATATLIFGFDTLQPWVTPCHNYTLKAEAEQLPFELNVTNNVLIDGQIHVRLMGDINGDGTVNFQDAILAGDAFSTNSGDPHWNPYADLNLDGVINYLDVILLGLNFGAYCPP